ncbi:MAG: hypothetical protein ACQEWV_13275 [Bacillota bacterium]
MTVNKNVQINNQDSNSGDSLMKSLTNSLQMIYPSTNEVENVSLQAFEYQKEVLEKVTEDINRIEQEQKKLVGELREVAKQNIQTIYGEEASGSFEKWNEHYDEVSSLLQQLTVTPFKEGLNILNQSQEQFQESVKKGIDQQQNLRFNVLNQINTSQKGFIDLIESNTKRALSFYK